MAAKRVAVVTGGNKGIGFCIVKFLCQKFDGDVILTSRDITRGKNAVSDLSKLNLSPVYHQLDIDDENSIVTFANFLKKEYGGLDVLVNNAGIAFKNDATEPFGIQAEVTVKTNFFSTLNVCKHLLPLLRKHARVVMLSSSAGRLDLIPSKEIRDQLKSEDLTIEKLCELMQSFVTAAKSEDSNVKSTWGSSTYIVSKVGLTALTKIYHRTLTKERPDDDIIINAVHPGYVDTDMTSHKGPLTPDQGADAPTYLALLPPNVDGPRGEYVWFDRKIAKWSEED